LHKNTVSGGKEEEREALWPSRDGTGTEVGLPHCNIDAPLHFTESVAQIHFPENVVGCTIITKKYIFYYY